MSTKTRKYLPQAGLSVFFEVLGASTFGTDYNFSEGRWLGNFLGQFFLTFKLSMFFVLAKRSSLCMMFLKIQTKYLDSRKHLLIFSPGLPLFDFFSAVFALQKCLKGD